MRFNFYGVVWEVTFRHFIYPKEEQKKFRRKAITVCAIGPIDGKSGVFGQAECSRKDVFSKRVGRELALERALNYLGLEQARLASQAYAERIRA